MGTLSLSDSALEELIALRRDFHRHPELGLQEYRTADVVERYLSDLGLPVRRVTETGVVALLEGDKPGPTLMLRSDMDALPITEETGLPFRSVNDGVMHACGHDAHMAMLLSAARILTEEYRSQITGAIKFVFQPNEEVAGAHLMIEGGVLSDPIVDAAAGLHIWSLLESGKIGVAPGPFMAEARYFHLTIRGVGGHAGFVHQSVDPINAAVEVIHAAKSVLTHESDPLQPTVVITTQFNAGVSPTIIPESATMAGSLRWLAEEDPGVEKAFRRIVDRVCAAHNVTYDLHIEMGNRVVLNDPAMTDGVRRAAASVIAGPGGVVERVQTMAGDDFGEFSQEVPSVYYFLGTRNASKGTAYPHHHPKFNIDEAVMPLGVLMHVNVALDFFTERTFSRNGGKG